MKGYVRISELGSASLVKYRAKILGIIPLKTEGLEEIRYSIEDAEKIVGYKPKPLGHNIAHYATLEFILNDDKLRYNPVYASEITKLKENKIQAMLDAYNKEGCFIADSKINNDATE